MNIQKTTKIASLTALIALTGASCWGATGNLNPETPIGSLARLYAEGPADLAPGMLESLYRKDLLQLALIGHREPQRFPMLYRDAMRELSRQKEEFIQILQKHNGDVQAALDAVIENNKAWAIDYLVQNGADLAKYNYGKTALTRAAHLGYGAVVAQLIANGAGVGVKDNTDNTALMEAARCGHEAVVAQLIANGANVNTQNNGGRTALMWAANFSHEAVIAQLIAARVDVNAKEAVVGWTALIYAAENGHVNVVAQLIAAGAYVNAKTNNGNTALSLAESVITDDGSDQAHRDGARAVVDLLTRSRSPLK